MKVLTTTVGPLTCHLAEEPAASNQPSLLAVLCHGFGAPGDDLVPLAEELFNRFPALAGRVRFAFPEAPMTLEGYGLMSESRAWWLIDMNRFLLLERGGEAALAALRADVPDGLSRARKLLLGTLDALLVQARLPMSKLVLGGFSQGAMLATDVALRLEEAPAALTLFSGTLLNEAEWRQRAPARRGLHVLQSHGRRDPILPYANAEALRDLLTGAGLEVDFEPFMGEHTIGLSALEKFGKLLLARAGA